MEEMADISGIIAELTEVPSPDKVATVVGKSNADNKEVCKVLADSFGTSSVENKTEVDNMETSGRTSEPVEVDGSSRSDDNVGMAKAEGNADDGACVDITFPGSSGKAGDGKTLLERLIDPFGKFADKISGRPDELCKPNEVTEGISPDRVEDPRSKKTEDSGTEGVLRDSEGSGMIDEKSKDEGEGMGTLIGLADSGEAPEGDGNENTDRRGSSDMFVSPLGIWVANEEIVRLVGVEPMLNGRSGEGIGSVTDEGPDGSTREDAREASRLAVIARPMDTLGCSGAGKLNEAEAKDSIDGKDSRSVPVESGKETLSINKVVLCKSSVDNEVGNDAIVLVGASNSDKVKAGGMDNTPVVKLGTACIGVDKSSLGTLDGMLNPEEMSKEAEIVFRGEAESVDPSDGTASADNRSSELEVEASLPKGGVIEASIDVGTSEVALAIESGPEPADIKGDPKGAIVA